MWAPKQRETPKPKYKGTIVCVRCHAEYNPETKWLWGYHKDDDTSADSFVVLGRIPDGACPCCNHKPKGQDNE